eukprot:gene12666-13966_t
MEDKLEEIEEAGDDELFANLQVDANLEVGEKKGSDNESDPIEDNDKQTKKIAKKAPSLQDQLLNPKVGVEALAKDFENVKFKGEDDSRLVDNLDLLISKYESWAHNMFPRYRFEDVVEGIEDLSSSKKIRSHVLKITRNDNEEKDANKVDSMDED